ncbi:DUF1772 domain-containing protein [Amycolatopsis taiwanensis]|uniref:anthrone oxygenase family protein n=1 Tax=Amycolatopsis taiwanensis TaxID=342230 RepID=UPI0004894634|nr:anthrone oxygenase family protein [Amycolatopsis taiwanensis]
MSFRILILVAAVGAGAAGGVFFAFSTFVMTGLRELPPNQAIGAMQAINRGAPRSAWFMALLGVTAVVALVVGIRSLGRLSAPSSWLVLAGCVLYLACLVVLAAYHVPHNDALALVDANAAGAEAEWNSYFTGWVAWNHVRTLTALGGSALFTLALLND